MLTIFTTAKPFKGHNATIQRNALQSWKLLDTDVEIVVFGDDEGSAEVCAELGLRHEPQIECNEFGTILVNAMFTRAQAIARHDVLCYVNCDIILMSDFRRAVELLRAAHRQFLMIGRRWDLDITEPLDFSSEHWEERIRERALLANRQRDALWIDYFVFCRGLYGADTPPLAIGRTIWDNWLVGRACASAHPVVDASRQVVAVHQNHDYAHHPLGKQGVWGGEEAKRNAELAGDPVRWGLIDHATLVLTESGLKRNRARHWAKFSRRMQIRHPELVRILIYEIWLPVWHFSLGLTRPVRRALGLTSESLRREHQKSFARPRM
jgi:hypothetical protein